MRVVGALLITVFILGGLRVFFSLRQQVIPPRPQVEILEADDEFVLEATLTFDAAPDEFAIQPTAMVVECLGKTLYAHNELIPAGTTVSIPLNHPFVIGENELFIRATPAADENDLHRAMRVRISRGAEDWVVDETLWSEAGEPVEAVVSLSIPSPTTPPESEADSK